jgi:hypothetical protein
MTMITVKTADLIGPALDWAVAKAEGLQANWDSRQGVFVVTDSFGSLFGWINPKGPDYLEDYAPSSYWNSCGPLIDKHDIGLTTGDAPTEMGLAGNVVTAMMVRSSDFMAFAQHGPTRLVAACRAIVAAKLADEVQVPAELVQGGAQ